MTSRLKMIRGGTAAMFLALVAYIAFRVIVKPSDNLAIRIFYTVFGSTDHMDPPVLGWAFHIKVALQVGVSIAALAGAVLLVRGGRGAKCPMWTLFVIALSTIVLAYLNNGQQLGRNVAALVSWGGQFFLLVWFAWFHFAVVPRARAYDAIMEKASKAEHPLTARQKLKASAELVDET